MSPLFGMLCLCALGLSHGKFARVKDDTKDPGARFLCRAIPVGADTCLVPAGSEPNASPQEEQLRNMVMQLRETILQQKETIVNQLGTINELTTKLSLCESASERRKYDGGGSWSKVKGNQDTMGDVPRDPNDTIDSLGRTMQSLKDRLENLEQQQQRANASGTEHLGHSHRCIVCSGAPVAMINDDDNNNLCTEAHTGADPLSKVLEYIYTEYSITTVGWPLDMQLGFMYGTLQSVQHRDHGMDHELRAQRMCTFNYHVVDTNGANCS
ncbi:hypothetical protein DPEC_G00357060 [Dallia pectoralis]|uniref:Uncharacterized protein n=1 Tax=Dallia pectoralis TaxID=75939 RepID=A0ACC2F0A0_DALPE|nr:hypothetical protein DPEC_G00357060 [Dallia pectoralis]